MPDINDILGINLPPDQPNSKRKLVEDAINNFIFSFGQGYSAQAGARGPQARSAGISAALQGPMIRQQMIQQQQNDAQDRAIKIQQLRQAALRGDQDQVLKLRDALQGNVQNSTALQYPTANGQNIPLPIQSAGDAMNATLGAEKAKLLLQREVNPPNPPNIDPNSQEAKDRDLAYQESLSKIPQRPTGAPTPPLPVEQQELADWLGKHPGKGPADFMDYKARFSNQLQQSNTQGAVKNVAPHLVATATADANKAGLAYADAQQAGDDMKTFLDLAGDGNKLAYAYAPTEGVLTLNTGRGVKRVNFAEIASYGGAGSAVDRIKAFFGKAAAGASIPKDVLDDMRTVHEAVTKNAKTAYARKLKVINQTYGAAFEPIDFSTPSDSSGKTLSPLDQEIINAANAAKKPK